jgi:serine/threonine-protein kinase
MAEVHLALAHGPLGGERLVVTKRLRPELAGEEEFVAMFLEEARLAARLTHPNVVHAYEVAEENGVWFIVMEFLDGQPLSRLRKKARAVGGIPLAIHLRILSEALAGLDYAHELSNLGGPPLEIVHRDMNPQNVFVCYDGRVKVLDFGIAKAASSTIETRAGWLKGKLAYMSPEQIRGERADRGVDIFSVGAMLWEAASGRRLWGAAEELTIVRRMMQNDLPWRSVEPHVPPEIAEIYQRALAVPLADRYSRAADMQRDIDAYLEQALGRAGTREVGHYVSDLFGEERERLGAIVGEELAKIAAGRPSAVPIWSSGPVSDRVSVAGMHCPRATQPGPPLAESDAPAAPLATTFPPVEQRRDPKRLVVGIAAGVLVASLVWGVRSLGRLPTSSPTPAAGNVLVSGFPRPASAERRVSHQRSVSAERTAGPEPPASPVSTPSAVASPKLEEATLHTRAAFRAPPPSLAPVSDALRKKSGRRRLDPTDPWKP